MNDTQLYLSIGIPTVTVILAWLSNKADMNTLRSEVKADNSALRAEFKAEINALRAEMMNLRKEIYEALIPLHERMAVIEIKQK
jgi:sensor domain CHASE-containing protein